MKKEIHPNWNKEAEFILNGKTVATVGSTLPEVQVSIWSGNHPFYTGEEIFVDTDNLVEKFQEKLTKIKVGSSKNKMSRRRQRDSKRTTISQDKELTLKDMFKSLN